MDTIFQDALTSILKRVKDDNSVDAIINGGELPFNFARKNLGETTISVVPKKYEEAFMKDPKGVREANQTVMKGGKFLMKLFPDATHQEIHNFLARLQGGTIEIIKGEDIRYWYSGDQYSNSESTDSLGSSCMRHDSCQKYMDIYVNNPEVCQMAILKGENDRLIGRAIMWKGVYKGETIEVMDRVYGTVKTHQLFKLWAAKNGYWHKVNQTYSDKTLIKDGDKISGDEVTISGDFSAEYYPYMDTFDRLNRDRDTLNGENTKYCLRSTCGEIDD